MNRWGLHPLAVTGTAPRRPAGHAPRAEMRIDKTVLDRAADPRKQLFVFERFHRIEGQRGRTHEGTGFNTIDPTRLFMLVTTSAADVAEADIQ